MLLRRLVLAGAVACCLAFATALTGEGLATPSDDASPSGAGQAAQSPQPGLVGTETCLGCHEGYDTGIKSSKHGFAQNPRTPMAAQGCETCHGPGEAHVQDPEKFKVRVFKALSSREANETCLTCHNRGEHAFWEGSAHDARSLSCATCHSVHQSKSPKALLVAVEQTSVCATCHRDKVRKLDRSGHMPVREGKMECTSCHNTHGSTNVRMLRAGTSVAESCTTCHADKRGPFLFEHAPVREGCVTCHDPHGTSNERLLVAKQPFLCQRCHIHTRHPATIYDGRVISTSNRLFGRSCVTCHANIHGSNHPSGATFLR